MIVAFSRKNSLVSAKDFFITIGLHLERRTKDKNQSLGGMTKLTNTKLKTELFPLNAANINNRGVDAWYNTCKYALNPGWKNHWRLWWSRVDTYSH